MIIIGLALLGFGVWLAMSPWGRLYAVGFFFTGIGNILFGITNGFVDMTPIGRLLFRIGLIAYIIGIPLIAYYLYGELSFE